MDIGHSKSFLFVVCVLTVGSLSKETEGYYRTTVGVVTSQRPEIYR
jgi:hypothetical protein